MKERTYWIGLGDLDLGEVLDGLQLRKESWSRTAEFLRSGISPDDSFIAEDCNEEVVAQKLVNFYETIIRTILRQRDAQDKYADREEKLPRRAKDGSRRMYCIFIDTYFQGPIPVEIGEDGGPVVYATRRAAECEIADDMIERLHQFVAGEREFEDASYTEEYVVPVRLLADGSIRDENGRHFEHGSWY